jgi:hypothetical protein
MTSPVFAAAPIQAGEAGPETIAILALAYDLAILAVEGPAPELPPGKRPVVGMHMGRVSNEQRITRAAKNRRCRQRQSEGKPARAGCYELAGHGGCRHPKHSRPKRQRR